MDKRISYKVVIDTETCPIDNTEQAVIPSNMLVYDVGWAITDKRGTVYRTRSFINLDVFILHPELMRSAYYAEKIPNYWEQLVSASRVMLPWWKIQEVFRSDVAEFSVKQVYAHNMRFDNGTLNETCRYLDNGKYFFPYGMEICDTLKMARDVLGKMPTYTRFCQEHGYTTKTGKPRFTAEIIYRFITGDTDFIESHTGLEDVLIEKEIMAYCYRQHKAMRRLLW